MLPCSQHVGNRQMHTLLDHARNFLLEMRDVKLEYRLPALGRLSCRLKHACFLHQAQSGKSLSENREMDVDIKADAELLNGLRMGSPAHDLAARRKDDFLIFPR
jgi:hypothetical protein